VTPEHNLGRIILKLGQHCTFVRFHRLDSVMGSNMYVIRAYLVKGSNTYTHEEMINELMLSEISDPDVIVDAFLARLRSNMQEKKK
jgi:hypothetical protein